MHFFHLLMFHYFHVALFNVERISCCPFPFIHFSHVTLFFISLSVLHFFQVTLFHLALFAYCTFSSCSFSCCFLIHVTVSLPLLLSWCVFQQYLQIKSLFPATEKFFQSICIFLIYLKSPLNTAFWLVETWEVFPINSYFLNIVEISCKHCILTGRNLYLLKKGLK